MTWRDSSTAPRRWLASVFVPWSANVHRKPWNVLLGLLLTLGAASATSRILVRQLAETAGHYLEEFARLLPAPKPGGRRFQVSDRDVSRKVSTPGSETGVPSPPSTRLLKLHKPPRSSMKRRPPVAQSSKVRFPRPSGGIFVPSSTVRAAVRSGIRPSASFVPANGDHPAGLLVVGWQNAHAGLRDGDIIIQVGASPARSVGQVVGAVIAAYEHKRYAVSGLIWRAGRVLSVNVELPKPSSKHRSKKPHE